MRGCPSPWGLCTSCFNSSCRIITPWGFLMTCRDYLAPGVMILLVRMAGILIPLDKGDTEAVSGRVRKQIQVF